jgi:hypothetical protein
MLDRFKTTLRLLGFPLLVALLAAGCVAGDDDDGGGDDDGGDDDGMVMCGDGVCATGETCAADCDGPDPGPTCGNGICETGETSACSDCAASTASLRTQNSSSESIWYLYVRTCGASSWGNDQLGANTIPVGNSFTLTGIPPGCYDFHADAQSGTWWERPGVTLLGGQTYTWTLID